MDDGRAGARRTPTSTSAGATARSRKSTFTDPNGHYEYPTAEGGALGTLDRQRAGLRALLGAPGPVVARRAHGRRDTVVRGRGSSGSGKSLRSHQPGRRPADEPAPAGRPPRHGRLGQARLPARRRRGRSSASPTSRRPATSSRPSCRRTRTTSPPSRTSPSYLEGPGPDGLAEHRRRRHRQRVRHGPLAAAEREPGPAGSGQRVHAELQPDPATSPGQTSPTQFNPISGRTASRCRSTGQQTKDGAFDGGYAFADYCPNGYDLRRRRRTC